MSSNSFVERCRFVFARISRCFSGVNINKLYVFAVIQIGIDYKNMFDSAYHLVSNNNKKVNSKFISLFESNEIFKIHHGRFLYRKYSDCV